MSIRRTQRDRILDLLRANKGRRVPSPALGRISLQYGARIKELRELGYQIRNEIERVDGQVYGHFILESEPESITVPDASQRTVDVSGPVLFADKQQPTSITLEYERGVRR